MATQLNLVFWKLQKKSCKWVGKPKPEDKQDLKALTKEYIVTNCVFSNEEVENLPTFF